MLGYLYLDQNQITDISSKTFAGLNNLKTLYLFRNNITNIAENAFYNTTLLALFLFDNRLTTLKTTSFSTRNRTLELIHLFHNDIVNISEESFNGMAPNATVYMGSHSLMRAPQIQARDVNILFVDDSFNATFHVMSGYSANMLKLSGCDCHKYKHVDFNCWLCPQGTYGDGIQDGCTNCPAGGFYQNETGQLQCKRCNNGTYVPVWNSPGKSPLDCKVCPIGTDKDSFAYYRACRCLANYTRRSRFGHCDPCPNIGINCSEEFQQVKEGYFWTWQWPNATDWEQNLKEYDKFATNILIYNSSYTKFTFHGSLPKAYPCPQGKRSCSEAGIAPSCAIGYTGWLCTECKNASSWNATYFSGFQRCIPCPQPWKAAMSYICLLLLLILLLTIIWKTTQTSDAKRSILDSLLAQFKIVLAFYQVSGAMFSALDSVPWPDELTNIGSVIQFLQLNLLKAFVKPSCYFHSLKFNAHNEFVIAFSFISIIFLIAFLWYLLKIVHIRIKYGMWLFTSTYAKDARMKCYLFTIVILFITFPSVCSVTLVLLPSGCDSYYLDENNTYLVQKLRADYSIDCNTDLHKRYTLAAYVALVYVIGFPLILMSLLWKHRKDIIEMKKIKGSYGFADKYVQTSTNMKCQPNNIQQDRLSINSEENNNEHDNLGEEYDIYPTSNIHQKDGYPVWLLFLCENYKAEFWYWEIVELTRKLLQISLLTMFGSNDSWYLAITVAVSMVYLTSYSYCRPISDGFEHALQMTSLASIFLNLLIATSLIMAQNNSMEDASQSTVVAVSLVILNVGVLLAVAVNVVLLIIKTLGQKEVGDRVASSWKVCIGCMAVLPTVAPLASNAVHRQQAARTTEFESLVEDRLLGD
ncbi:uncharacterized protein [Amphiura filiformis]|uniref:uncharacterized protein n=1 Tax=Amphiura filiformis TaxID=82378 RepID=UPI003B219669